MTAAELIGGAAVLCIAWVIPFRCVLGKIGVHRGYAFFAAIPVAGVAVTLAVIAFAPWTFADGERR